MAMMDFTTKPLSLVAVDEGPDSVSRPCVVLRGATVFGSTFVSPLKGHGRLWKDGRRS